MNKLSKILTFSILAVFLLAGNALALDLGTNITIYDNRKDTSNNSWYNQEGEDQEVEPGMVANQDWDLEGFFLNGTTLTMVGGFNFKDGVSDGSDDIRSGDIFIDINDDASYGVGANSANNYGYDYVLDLDFSNLTYDVYKLSSVSSLLGVHEYNAPESNPWRYGGELDKSSQQYIIPSTSLYNGTIGLLGYGSEGRLEDTDVGFIGGDHYAVSVDLGGLSGLSGYDGHHFIAHFTMECGNDNLMAHAAPEPATMLLFGTGLIGLAGLGRKKFRKK